VLTISGRCSFVSVISLVVWGLCSQTSADPPFSDSCRHSLWGSLPQCAREIGRAEGITLVEVSEDLPQRANPEEPFVSWLVWPIQDWKNADTFINRAGPFSMDAQTPIGTFYLGVRPGIRAVRKKGDVEGLLTLLCFDPNRKGPLQYPWPEMFTKAREEKMLTPAQGDLLATVEEHLKQKYPRLPREWADFTQATYVMYTRRQLLTVLTELYSLPPGCRPKALDPREFFNRDQRIRLRAQGHAIPGTCLLRCERDRLVVELKNCPVSQLVAQWNRIVHDKLDETGRNTFRLRATDSRTHDELDITLDVTGVPLDEAARIALGALLNVPGIQMDE